MPIVFRQISAKDESSTLCRLCATQSDPRTMAQIFIDSLDSLEIRISHVSPVQLCCGDGLPASVCKLCVTKLDVTTQFISEAIATYESLHKVLTFISKAPSLDKHEHGFTDKALLLFEVMTGKYDLSSICRLCATQHDPFNMSKIFVGVCNLYENKIRSVLHTKMSEGDGLPDSLCSECVSKLDAAHNFIMVSFASDNFLRNVLYKGIEVETVIKQEKKFDLGDPVLEKSSEGSPCEAASRTQGEQAIKTEACNATMTDSTPKASSDGAPADYVGESAVNTSWCSCDDLLAIPLKEEKPEDPLTWRQAAKKLTELHAITGLGKTPTNHQEDTEPTELQDDFKSIELQEDNIKPSELETWHQHHEMSNEIQMRCHQNSGSNLMELRSVRDTRIQAAEIFTCASCATEFPTEKALRQHFIGSEHHRFCSKIFLQNQPSLKLVRLVKTEDIKRRVNTVTDEKPPELRTELQQVKMFKCPIEASTEIQTSVNQNKKSTELWKASSGAYCAEEIATKKELRQHFNGVENLRFCNNTFQKIQPIIKLIRLEEMGITMQKYLMKLKISNQNPETLDCATQFKNDNKLAKSSDFVISNFKGKGIGSQSMLPVKREDKMRCKDAVKISSRIQNHVAVTKLRKNKVNCNLSEENLIQNHVSDNCVRSHSKARQFSVESSQNVDAWTHRNSSIETHGTKQAHNKKLINKHSIKQAHVCDICKKSLTSERGLAVHMRKHKGKRPYCAKTFTKQHVFDAHALVHTGTRPEFVCDFCEIQFTGKQSLRKHMVLHAGEQAYVCATTFRTRARLPSNAGACEICKMTFSDKKMYSIHMLSHCRDVPFSCQSCAMTFVAREHLSAHACTHTETKKAHVCATCKKPLASKQSLANHMLLHLDERRFSCTVCAKSFRQPAGLCNHLRIHRRTSDVSTETLDFRTGALGTIDLRQLFTTLASRR